MNTIKYRTALNTLLAASVITLCGAAQAGEYKGETTITRASQTAEKWVSYADLDLSSEKGRETLARRIGEAARDVCGPVDYRIAGSVRLATHNRNCIEQAYGDAMARVSSGTSVAVRD